jgi:hypothetical protein
VKGVSAHQPEGLRKQLRQSEAEADEMRQEGKIPTLLLGSDASTLSEDPKSAVAGAWLAIGVFTIQEVQSKAMDKWRKRIKWKNREAHIWRSKNVLGHESRQNNNGRGNISHTPGDEVGR